MALARRPERMPRILAGIAAALETVRAWLADQDLFEWVEPRGGVVGFPRFRPDVPVDVDAFYRILLERYGTIVGPGHWFDQPRRHFRLGYGWPTPTELEQGLAAITAAAVEAFESPPTRPGRRLGAAIGNALLEMDRQIFRDTPRVEQMVKSGSETVGLAGDGGLVVRLPASEPDDSSRARTGDGDADGSSAGRLIRRADGVRRRPGPGPPPGPRPRRRRRRCRA